MKKLTQIMILISILVTGCEIKQNSKYEVSGKQSIVIKEMIDAVNKKNAKQYVKGFADKVQVYVESDLKVNGKENLITNRAKHFKSHPNVRSEIQHLVEIDNKVIMHDKVWLDNSDKIGQNIVEIFTFENGKVIRVDVIQPNDLFRN